MTKREVAKFKKLLLIKRAILQGDAEALERETVDWDTSSGSGSNSTIPTHWADAGTDAFEQEFAITHLENKEKILQDIDDALNRVKNGVYGKCMNCGCTIQRSRLEALLWAENCIECQSEVEKNGD